MVVPSGGNMIISNDPVSSRWVDTVESCEWRDDDDGVGFVKICHPGFVGFEVIVNLSEKKKLGWWHVTNLGRGRTFSLF